MLDRGSILSDRFEVLARTGTGGMATVLRAHDRRSGQLVAIKVLRASDGADSERFAREARTLARMRHPGIVAYVAHGETPDGDRWLAMEWVDGEDLGARLGDRPLALDETIALGRRVAEALETAHAEGVVHRDVKPSNLLLPGGRVEDVKVADFGIARLAWATSPTRTGSILGTPGYIAPEQVRGDDLVDARADVFSLGCVLYRCIAGRPPFDGAHATAVLAKVLLEDPPTLRSLAPDVPEALEALVSRMLAKDPSGRPDRASDVARALADLADATPAQRSPPSSRRAITRGERRLFSVVLASGGGDGPKLAEVVASFGGRLDRIRDGTLVATIPGSGDATDQAARAAGAALGMRETEPGLAMAVATGSADVEGRWPVGEAIDRAVALVREPGAIRIDDVTASLLGERFDVRRDADGAVLQARAQQTGAAPRLLGKASPFVGRDWEVGWLLETFEECAAEPGARAVLVTADAGIGKSRLLSEVVRRIGARAEIWRGVADAARAGTPFSVVGSAVRSACGVRDGDPAAARRAALRARVGSTRIAAFLGEVCGAPFPETETEFLRAARADPVVMSDQVRRAFEDWLDAETARPVVLALEDLQWADRPSIRLVASALRSLRARPLFVLAFARPAVHDLFPDLWADAGLSEIRIAGLATAAGEAIARAALPDADAERIAGIVSRADGNPLFLEELVRAEAVGGGSAAATVLAMLRARLESLDAPTRRVLRAASIFGVAFRTAGVAALCGEAELATRSVLTGLESVELVVWRGDDGWSFRHDLVREAASDMLTDDDRVLGHRLAGELLEASGETDALVLADHFERGGDRPRAARHWLAAARQALEANDLDATIVRADRGLACGAEGALRGALLVEQAEAYKWHGRQPDMLRCAAEAMTLLDPGSPPWCIAVCDVAHGHLRLGDPDGIVAVSDALLGIDPGDDAETWLVAAARTGQALLYGGKREALARLVRQMDAVEARANARSAYAAARLCAFRGACALVAGESERYLPIMEEAIERFVTAGDDRGASVARAELGYGLIQLACDKEAERVLRESLAGGERLGLAHVVALAQNNLGVLAARRGALEEARALEETAIEAYRAQGNRRAEAGCRAYLAAIQLQSGDVESAEREARTAVSLLAPAAPMRAFALATLAKVLLAGGRTPEALSAAREAAALLETLGQIDEGEPLVRLVLAESLAASGDREGARKTIEAARDRLMRLAERIADPTLRQRFLSGVPEHAKTLELAKM